MLRPKRIDSQLLEFRFGINHHQEVGFLDENSYKLTKMMIFALESLFNSFLFVIVEIFIVVVG